MRKLTAGFGAALLVTSLGMVAKATASESSTVIYGCIVPKTNVLRVVSGANQCLKIETPIQWNATGQPGAAGTSVTATTLAVGDSHCPDGGVKLTSASGDNYVCNGADASAGTFSFDEVDGAACRVGDPLVGVMQVSYDQDGDVSLRCVPTDAYPLQVSLTGSGTGTVTSSPAAIDCPDTCSANFPQSTSVVLTATPTAGHVFDSWTGDCSSTTATTCTVDMAHAANVTAKFRLLRTLRLLIENAGTIEVRDHDSNALLYACVRSSSGTYSQPGGCATAIDNGREITLVPVFSGGSTTFYGYTNSASSLCDHQLDCTMTMTSSQELTAWFDEAPPL